jgi:predicted O-methyltransferase YrrM
MPLAVMEAMAASLPVCASAVSGIPEQLGNEGILLPNPNTDSQATILGLAHALLQLAGQPDIRRNMGANLHQRAVRMFSESRMISSTVQVLKGALLPPGDYVSPTLEVIHLDHASPNMIVGNTDIQPWPHLRRHATHNWYVDARAPMVGFLSRDEASILYDIGRTNAGSDALEIGCWLGWSACHLAAGGLILDVIDPLLAKDDIRSSVERSVEAAACVGNVRLHAGRSPDTVHQLAADGKRWRVIFIDGDHEGQAPLADAIVSAQYAQKDAIIIFHDVVAPAVEQALNHLSKCGWNTQIFNTMQVMAVAWRGNIKPPEHQADPLLGVTLPDALQRYAHSNVSNAQDQQVGTAAAYQALNARLESATILVAADLKMQYPNCPDFSGALFERPAAPAYMHPLYDSPRDISAAYRASSIAQFHGHLYSAQVADWLASSGFLQYADMRTMHEFNDFHVKVRNHTFLSRERLWGLYCATRQICESDMAGDIVECGAWRGGSAALIALTVKKYSKRHRVVSVFDSFGGMPPASHRDVHRGVHANSTEWGEGALSAPPDRYIIPLLVSLEISDYVSLRPGDFETSLPDYAKTCTEISILHAAADWYSSTNTILDNLLSKLSPHAYIQIDDYGFWDGCRQAIDERAEADRRLQSLNWLDNTGVWCRIPSLRTELFTDQISRLMSLVSLVAPNESVDAVTILSILRPQLVVRPRSSEAIKRVKPDTISANLTLLAGEEAQVRDYVRNIIESNWIISQQDTPEVYCRIIDCYLLLGQLPDAFKYSCSAVLRYPELDSIRTRLATVLLSCNLVQLAINVLTETLDDPVTMVKSRVLLARIHRALNDREMCARILTPLVVDPGAPVLGPDVYTLYAECLISEV